MAEIIFSSHFCFLDRLDFLTLVISAIIDVLQVFAF